MVSWTNSTFGVRSGVKPCFVTSALCVISMCKSLYQASVFLTVKWEFHPFFCRALGRISIQVYGTSSTVLGTEGGREPHILCGLWGRGSSPGEGLS